MAKVEIKKTSGGGGGGNVSFTSVTYAQLVTLIGSSGLIQGDSYLITDFQTIYDQPDFDSFGNAQLPVPTLSGAIEPLIVEAVSTNEISNQAFSTVYENDLILYNWNFQATETNTTPAKGIITRRTTDYYNDGRRNSTPYDSRAVLFKRYESVSGSGIYNSYKDTGFASSNVPTFGNNCTSNYIGNFWNTDINAYIMGYPFVLPNTVWGNNSSFNKVGDQAFNVTLGDFNCDNNNIGNYFYNNTIGAYFKNNQIGDYFNSNVADDNFKNNNIGNYFQQNTSIGNNFMLNNIGNYFYSNVSIGVYFQSNQIGNYFGTDITLDGGLGNTIGYNFASNVIGDFFNSNTVANDVENMNIEGYFQSKLITGATNTKTWVGGLNTGFVNNTSGFLESKGYGLASQYVRADGTFASFPDVSGGGGGQVYYFNGGTSEGTIGGKNYYQLSTAASLSAGVDFTSGTVNDVAFANFITDVGKPTQETIPAGVWIFQCYLSASSSPTCEVYATVEVYDGSTFTVLSTSLHETLTGNSTIDLYTFTCAVPEYTPLTPTDRIAIRFYPNNLGGTKTITLHTQDSHLSSVQTTFTTGIASLDGLTAAAQYFQVGTTGTDFNIGTSGVDTHTFNLPTASASNRGALSTSDWTTFNSKVDGSGTLNYISKFTASGTIGNSLIQDNGTTIGVNTAPLGNIMMYVTPPATIDVGYRVNNIYTGSAQAFGLIAATTGVSSGSANIGVYASAGNNPNGNFGIQARSIIASATAINVGGSFQATNGLTNYAVQLKDGTETLGRFLKCVTATNGYANWANITVADVTNAVSTSTTISTTSPLSGGGDLSTNRTLSISQSNGTTNGYLSSADWTTFNNKIGGSGTLSFVPRFTGASTIGNGVIQDNGTNLGVGIAPSTPYKLRVTTSTASQYGIYGEGLGQGFSGVAGIASGAGALQNTGVYGSSTGSTNINVGVQGEVDNVTSVNIGGQFSATSGSANYSLQLQDGSEASGKFLKSVTSTGRANWANITVADTGLTLTTTGTSGASTLVGNTLNIPQYAGGLTYFTEAQNTAAPNATIPVDSLTAVSASTNADIAIIPKGNGAILRQIPDNTTNGGNKRGANAIDFQYGRTAATQVASGAGSIAFGNNNTISGLNGIVVGNTNNLSGDNSYVFGQSNTSLIGYDFATAFGSGNAVNRRSSFASGTTNTVTSRDGAALGLSNSISADYGFALGTTNTVSASNSVALGINCTASGTASIALGKGSTTGINRSKLALSSGFEATSGDSQFGIQVLKNRTTGNTVTRLYADTVGAVASTQVYPPLNGAYRFKGTIIGKQTGTLNAAAWDIDGIIVKGATEASISLLIGNVILVQNTPAWGTPTLTADTGSGGSGTIAGTLNISVVGATTTNIQWVCTIQTTEVIY